MPETEQQLDVRKIPPHKKHSTIFDTYDALRKRRQLSINQNKQV